MDPRQSRLSRFSAFTAVCRRLSRFSSFTVGGLPFLESIPSPPTTCNRGRVRRRGVDKKAAKRAHRKLLGRLNPAVDALIYTDGSAVPNPGKIGLGVTVAFNNKTLTISSPMGIGSILTAELCAIKVALMKLRELILKRTMLGCRRALVFSDCPIAIDSIPGATWPSGDFKGSDPSQRKKNQKKKNATEPCALESIYLG